MSLSTLIVGVGVVLRLSHHINEGFKFSYTSITGRIDDDMAILQNAIRNGYDPKTVKVDERGNIVETLKRFRKT